MNNLFQVRRLFFLISVFLVLGLSLSAQFGPSIEPALPPPDGPVKQYTAEYRIRAVPVARGLSHPWGMAFRRNGDILITERDRGALRVVRNGQLIDGDIAGVPEVYVGNRLAGLMDVAVHPDDDSVVYLTYSKA